MTGGIEFETERIEAEADDERPALGPPPSPTPAGRAARQAAELRAWTRLPMPVRATGLDGHRPAARRCPAEPPGDARPSGSWEIARRLMRGYEFADPSIVRAYYDPDVPLQGRNMLLKLQALGHRAPVRRRAGRRCLRAHARRLTAAQARVWGWNYRTLEGHVEMGQMAWEVWKWLDDGAVEFRVHAISRPAPIGNPAVRLGFWRCAGTSGACSSTAPSDGCGHSPNWPWSNNEMTEHSGPLGRLYARPIWISDAADDCCAQSSCSAELGHEGSTTRMRP